MYCNHPIAGSDWGRANFTGFRTDCTIFVDGVSYSADGARSAWQVYADANPDQVLNQAYLVADETGRYLLDRLSLGAGVEYGQTDTRGVSSR